MVNQLSQLQGVNLSSDIKSYIQNLQKQSEMNIKILSDSPKTSQSFKISDSPEQRLKELIEANSKQSANHLTVTPEPIQQSPQEIDYANGSEINPILYKKIEVTSPLQEGKYNPRKKAYGFIKKTNLQIDVHAANEENNETGKLIGIQIQ